MTTSNSASALINSGTRTGSHLLHVEGYSRTKELPNEESILSESFNVGDWTWRIQYSPRGQGGMDTTHIWLKLVLVGSYMDPNPPRARATFVLLDQAGNEVPAFTRRVEWDWYQADSGYRYIVLIEREAVEASSDLIVHDCLKIRCDVAVLMWPRTERRGPPSWSLVPPPDLHSHLSHLLAAREGADVTFQVAGEVFSAHKCILAARSPVFRAELFGAMKESSACTGVCIRIGDMLPQVFNALLHFIYTDSLPEMAGQEEVLMAQHLLEAADRYAMERLKLICEEKLCNSLDVDTIASTIVLAEQHSCHRLKEACFVFLKSSPSSYWQHIMATSGSCLQDVMATSGFEHLTKCFPALLRELISKLATPCPYMKDPTLQ